MAIAILKAFSENSPAKSDDFFFETTQNFVGKGEMLPAFSSFPINFFLKLSWSESVSYVAQW